MSYKEPNGPQSIHCRCKLICTCLWLKVSKIMKISQNLLFISDTQIGLLGGSYSLALDDSSAFNSYNLMLTNLLLYLTNVNSHDFFIHFDISFSPSAKLKMSREKSISREKPLSPFVSREISPLTRAKHAVPFQINYIIHKKIYQPLGPQNTPYIYIKPRYDSFYYFNPLFISVFQFL